MFKSCVQKKQIRRHPKVVIKLSLFNCNLLISVGGALDPRYKMKLIDFSFKAIYFADEATNRKKIMRDTLDELYDEYVEAHRAGHAVSNANIGSQSCVSKSGLGSTSKT
nr:zinc finger BED domain-containing protein RICESLEEPER 2-like [Tanacetum cinerariifolium]